LPESDGRSRNLIEEIEEHLVQSSDGGRSDPQTDTSGKAAMDEIGADVRHTLGEAAHAAADKARDAAAEAKSRGAGQMAGVSRAVHDAADKLGEELPQAAGLIHSAAQKLDDASAALRDRKVEDLVSGFSDFARRQPGAAFAGSLLAGFALSRFLKSSGPRGASQERE
jgi:hypothetical protein